MTKLGDEMTHSAPDSFLGSEFDDFLFAPIGEDRNGMLLSVLSMLVRLDVDPWQEAAKLARLSTETATQRLASLIGALPDPLSVHPGLGAAPRLIALLPPQPSRLSKIGFWVARRLFQTYPANVYFVPF